MSHRITDALKSAFWLSRGPKEPAYVVSRGADIAHTKAVQYAAVFERELIVARAEGFRVIAKLEAVNETRRHPKRWRR